MRLRILKHLARKAGEVARTDVKMGYRTYNVCLLINGFGSESFSKDSANNFSVASCLLCMHISLKSLVRLCSILTVWVVTSHNCFRFSVVGPKMLRIH